MSLRASPRNVVLVQKMSPTIGTSGQTKYIVPDGAPIRVACNVYPLSSDERSDRGLVNDVTVQVILHRSEWPGDQHARITYDGSVWEQVGPADRYVVGHASRNTQVVLRRVGTDHASS
jgi:hypothetical protein